MQRLSLAAGPPLDPHSEVLTVNLPYIIIVSMRAASGNPYSFLAGVADQEHLSMMRLDGKQDLRRFFARSWSHAVTMGFVQGCPQGAATNHKTYTINGALPV